MYKENDIIKWASDRRIIQESNPIAQAEKNVEESIELLEAIQSGDAEEVRKEAGDVFVTLVLACALSGLSLSECVDAAYNKIKDRKGMMLQGKFTKESDMKQLHDAGFALFRDKFQKDCEDLEARDSAVSLLASFGLRAESKFYSDSKRWAVWV